MDIKNQDEKTINADLGIFLLRIALAAVFIFHGAGKLMDVGGTSAFFTQFGLSAFWVYLVALVELFSGIAMLIGMVSEWAGILLALDMLGAMYFVKFSRGFIGGYELELTLLLASLTITFAGAGAYTLSRLAGGAKIKPVRPAKPIAV